MTTEEKQVMDSQFKSLGQFLSESVSIYSVSELQLYS